MSGFDSLWGDELTENDVAEFMEIETQASQISTQSTQRPSNELTNQRVTSNVRHASILSNIPRILQTQPYKSFRDGNRLPTTASSSTSSSPSPCFMQLTENQRKLKTPVRSLPEMSLSQSKERNQLATTEWLRKELEKTRKNYFDIEEKTQTLEGEVKVLRERNNTYQSHIVKVREQAETEFKEKEDKLLSQIKELKKEAESANVQLALKTKELEANSDRYLELKSFSVLEPEFPRSQMPPSQRFNNMNDCGRGRSIIRPDVMRVTNEDDDYEDDYFSDRVLTKKVKRDEPISSLKSYTADQLIQIMDAPKLILDSKNDKLDCADILSSHNTSLTSFLQKDVRNKEKTSADAERIEVQTDPAVRLPWLKPKCYSLVVHQGRLLNEKISQKIYILSEPEIKIIITPVIDFDPGNVLKMDGSDLEYLEDLERGEKIWGVDLKTMYSSEEQESQREQTETVENNADAFETVKTILGSQMCVQSPDQVKFGRSLIEPKSPPESSVPVNNMPARDESILLTNLEPIHVHLKALTKLSDWYSSMDLISSIVLHFTSMINELHERVCEPRIPDQLKDQFYSNEFATGNLFMNGPYESKDLLSHEKWTERERYVELRRGLAVLAILCFINKDTANLVLDSQLLKDVSTDKSCIIKPRNEETLLQDCYLNTSLRYQSQRKILAKADSFTCKYSEMFENEGSEQTGTKSDAVTYCDPGPSTSYNLQNQDNYTVPNHEVAELLKVKSNDDAKSTQGLDDDSMSSTNTVNADEIMDVDLIDITDETKSSESRSVEEINHQSFRAWYDLYAQNRSNLSLDEPMSASKSHKYNKLLDPQLTESERKELSVYLKRTNFYKDFYKAVAEKGSVWAPDKSDEGEVNIERNFIKNLFDYENKVSSNISTTMTSDELINMRPGAFHPVEDSNEDCEITVKSQEESSAENEWRVNSLQKNKEDANLAKEGERKTAEDEKNLSFFEKFKKTGNDNEGKESTNTDITTNVNNGERLKPTAAKSFKKHSLAPLKNKGGNISRALPDSLNSINKEMELEVEMLYDKVNKDEEGSSNSEEIQIQNEMSRFDPEHRFPETINDNNPKSDTLIEYMGDIPSLEDADFMESFHNLFNECKEILKNKSQIVVTFDKTKLYSYLQGKKSSLSNQLNKKNGEVRRPEQLINNIGREGASTSMTTGRSQGESDAVITMLNEEALKYSLTKQIKIFEKKKGNLNILDGIHEIVCSINYCRLTMVFYPLLSSCVRLMESLLSQSFNNNYFHRDSFLLIMKILNEISCCQPPPDIIEKILGVLIYAIKFQEILECLCKKRSNLVSLVTKTEFCFFKGVCMMQPLCYLIGSVSVTRYPGYWSLSLTFTNWLRQLYEKYRLYLEAWYPPSSVCNCVPVLHSALFATLSRATSFRYNHGCDLMNNETLRKTIDEIIRNGISLCEILIDLDNSFKNHLDKFHLFEEFLSTVKDMHSDTYFYPSFLLEKNELAVVECLIKANRMLARSLPPDPQTLDNDIPQDTKNHFNRAFDSNHIFLTCSDKYDLQC